MIIDTDGNDNNNCVIWHDFAYQTQMTMEYIVNDLCVASEEMVVAVVHLYIIILNMNLPPFQYSNDLTHN